MWQMIFLNKIKVFSLLLLSFMLFAEHGIAEAPEGLDNYCAIREMHIKWEMGLWGSKSYYEKQLRKLLINMLDRDIRTDFDYIPNINRIIVSKKLLPDTYFGKWLYIYGDIEPDSLKGIMDLGKHYIREIETRKYLFAVSGKIKKFRLEDSQRGRILHLHLYSVKLIPHVNKN